MSKEGLMLQLLLGTSELSKLAGKPWETVSVISDVASKAGIKVPDVAYFETIQQDLRKVEQESHRLRNIAVHLHKMYQ